VPLIQESGNVLGRKQKATPTRSSSDRRAVPADGAGVFVGRRGGDVTVLESHTIFAPRFRGEGLQLSAERISRDGLGEKFDACRNILPKMVEISLGGN